MTDDVIGPSAMHITYVSLYCHMYMTDFAYDGPIFLVPSSPSYPGSPGVSYNSFNPYNVFLYIIPNGFLFQN